MWYVATCCCRSKSEHVASAIRRPPRASPRVRFDDMPTSTDNRSKHTHTLKVSLDNLSPDATAAAAPMATAEGPSVAAEEPLDGLALFGMAIDSVVADTVPTVDEQQIAG